MPNVENLTYTGTAAFAGTGKGAASVITGGAGNDTLHVGAGDDMLNRGLGNDILNGGNGNDYLDGGLGNDTLTGGAGTDVFFPSYDGSLDTLTDFSPSLGDVIVFNRASFGILVGSAVSSYVPLGTSAPSSAHGYILANSTGVFRGKRMARGRSSELIAKFTTAPTGMTLSSFNFA